MIDPSLRWQVLNADCLAVLRELPDGCVDAVVTDPPYGVGFSYASHNDTSVGYRQWCDLWFAELKRVSTGPVSVSPGIGNLTEWPKPSWVLCWHKPAAMGRCPIGFNNWEPVLVYGRSRGGQTNDVFVAPIVPDDAVAGHPCPKPVGWGLGVVNKTTKAGDLILDPFCGSGTTGVACMQTGRRFIGVEIDEGYADIARRRIAEAANTLWTPDAPPEPEKALFAEGGAA